MPVSCGIVGLPNVGKSTLFNALTTSDVERTDYPFSTTGANLATVSVPDPNLEVIHGYIETKKVIPTVMNVVDIAGLSEGASRGEGLGNQFLHHVREVDAIMHVVRCFEGSNVMRQTDFDPPRDMEVLEMELALADLDTVQRAVERVSKKARSGDKESIYEKELFERAVTHLEAGELLSAVEWKPEEAAALRPLCLMSTKRMLYVANVGEDDLAGEGPGPQAVKERALAAGAEWLPICGDLECELGGMDGDDRTLFMGELGIETLGLERLIHATYALLGLQTFYTAGEKEIRAWTIKGGSTGPVAAGVIHSDFEKAFIRAEVYSVSDLVEHGSEAAIRAAGRLRTEGREYLLAEGDVVHFLVGR